MSLLPESYIKDGAKLAEGCYAFGVPIVRLSREELLACLAHALRKPTKVSVRQTDSPAGG